MRTSELLPPGFLSVLAGIFGGLCVTIALYYTGALLAWAGPSGEEFGPSKGSAALWVLESIGVLAASVYLCTADANARLSPSRRGVLLGLCFVTLGGMALCDLFSVPALFVHRS